MGQNIPILAPFVDAGVFEASDVHVAALVARTLAGLEPEVMLATALAARAPRLGYVCVEIGTVAKSIVIDETDASSVGPLAWPDPARWAKLLAKSPAVRRSTAEPGAVILPLVWDGTRLYLERYWRFEESVARELLRRAGTDGGLTTESNGLEAVLGELFESGDLPQSTAARKALTRRLAVIGGGPGTGKTSTIARLLAAASAIASSEGRRLEVALAAPTGKAAARMKVAVQEADLRSLGEDVADALRITEAKTLHRLLGMSSNGIPRHDHANPLPHDMVVVDETSMVSLPLMARLLDAVRPEATLVLVGDPSQLASVEAGAVLGEIVGPMAGTSTPGPLAADIVLLEHNYRSAPKITELAAAIRKGEEERALEILCEGDSGELSWVSDDNLPGIARLQAEAAECAADVVRAAVNGEGEEGLRIASKLKVLCATRFGSLGVFAWGNEIEDLIAQKFPEAGIGRRGYVGRPIIVTRNDYPNKLFNGDVGLVVAGENGTKAVFRDLDGQLREFALSQLGEIDTWWATTIHKSQGSEFDRVIVSLPPVPSPILTRELLYTAVTRAKQSVTIVGAEESLRAAIAHPVDRPSGLGAKLWP
jgi:exodeoxyribonuclease V alpha subunit